MRKILLSLLLIFSVVFLSGCTYSESRQINVVWESSDKKLVLYSQGAESSKVYGFIIIDDQETEIVGFFYWNQSRLVVYTGDQVKSVESNELKDLDAFIVFNIDPIFLSNTSIRVKTMENKPGYDILGDLSFKLNSSEIDIEKRNAQYFISIDWYNEDTSIYFHNSFQTVYSGISYGTIQIEDEIIDIEFTYIDEENYVIKEVGSNQLIISGEYYLDSDNLVLLVEYDEYFQNQYEVLIFSHVEDYE